MLGGRLYQTRQIASREATETGTRVLEILAGQLESREKSKVLDLGPAMGANIEFFSQFSCTLYIEDLFRSVSGLSQGGWEDSAWIDMDIQRLFTQAHAGPFDVVLCWDLFNYLDPDPLARLLDRMRVFCRPGTVLFAHISTQSNIPATPTSFKILDRQRLVCVPSSAEVRVCPRYAQLQLRKIMAGFTTTRVFQLRNGMQECLFTME